MYMIIDVIKNCKKKLKKKTTNSLVYYFFLHDILIIFCHKFTIEFQLNNLLKVFLYNSAVVYKHVYSLKPLYNLQTCN